MKQGSWKKSEGIEQLEGEVGAALPVNLFRLFWHSSSWRKSITALFLL